MMTVTDNKKNHYGILLWGIVLITLLLPCLAAAAPQTSHPLLLFHDISEAPGYQYRTVEPWKGWEKNIIRSANTSLSLNFSENLGVNDHIDVRGAFARDLGLAYQITKKPDYALKAREALLTMETGTVGEGGTNADVRAKQDKAGALEGYSLAYDWVQPTLDPATDLVIRDKLAVLADTVYKDLNDEGTNPRYIDFSDHLGQAYPAMGVASAVLADYTNPHHRSLSSGPSTWHRVGTEYLFENDALHSYNRSAFSFGFDEASGKSYSGAYKEYVTDDFALWFQVSNHVYGENLLDRYPAAQRAFTSEEWESLPNGYGDNYVTNGNTKWTYHTAFVSLLPDAEKSEILNHLDRIANSGILPYSSVMTGTSQGGISSALLYSVYGNYSDIPRAFPAHTSHLNPDAITQVFRGTWNSDSDWLSLITFNPPVTRTNRDMGHHDQLSFEYYSRGDLLLADGGEPKHTLEYPAGYGKFAMFHNTITLGNPRSPFPPSAYSGSSSRGIYKGENTELVTPSTVDTVIEAPWIQALKTHVTITRLSSETADIYSTVDLTSPIQYSRTVLYPDSDYFIIVDRLEGTEAWTYNTIFRPTSLMVTPTTDTDKNGIYTESEVGHVNGDLTVGTTPFNWQALSYKTPTPAGQAASTISWTTRNPYGNAVNLDIVSAPASEVLVTKYLGRIGGYDDRSEVYNPVVYLSTPPATSLYRVTALLSRYPSEDLKSAKVIPVNGTGNALAVHSSLSEDFIYTGTGNSSFNRFSTDADTVFIRIHRDTREITMLNGSFLAFRNERWVDLPERTDHLSIISDGNSTEFRISREQEVSGSLFSDTPDMVRRSLTPGVVKEKSTPLDVFSTMFAGGVLFIVIMQFKKKE